MLLSLVYYAYLLRKFDKKISNCDSTRQYMLGANIAKIAKQCDTLQRIQSICRRTGNGYNKIATFNLQLITIFKKKLAISPLHREQNRDSKITKSTSNVHSKIN